MLETTHVRPADHCEVYSKSVDGIPSDVYAFADSLPRFRGVRWVEGRNPAFRHASNVALAMRYLADRFIVVD